MIHGFTGIRKLHRPDLLYTFGSGLAKGVAVKQQLPTDVTLGSANDATLHARNGSSEGVAVDNTPVSLWVNKRGTAQKLDTA